MSAPWTQDQFPLIAEWLVVNQQPLNQVAMATTMSNFYVPLVYSSDPPAVSDAKLPRAGRAAFGGDGPAGAGLLTREPGR